MRRKTIEDEVMKLPAAARGKLAAALLTSLETNDAAEMERAWVKEAQRRYKGYRSGRTKATSAKEAIAAARAGLQRV